MSNYYGDSRNENRAGQLSSALANTFMQKVYAIMAVGLFITGLTAWFVGSQLVAGEWQFLLESPIRYVVMFTPLVFAFTLTN